MTATPELRNRYLQEVSIAAGNAKFLGGQNGLPKNQIDAAIATVYGTIAGQAAEKGVTLY